MALTYFDEQAPELIFGVMRAPDFPGPAQVGAIFPNVLRIDALWALNTDSVENVLTLLIGGVEVASVAVPARAGLDGTAPADLLGHLSVLAGWQGLVLPGGTECQMSLASAPGDGQLVQVVGTGGLIPALVGL